jgi:hypothetical protein
MSRSVRRVPVDFKHPTQPNPHWEFQASFGRTLPPSRLHGPTEMFTPLYGTPVTQAQDEWDRGRAQWEAGEHEHLAWLLKYHAPHGYTGRNGVTERTPYDVYAADGNTIIHSFYPTSVEQILEHYPYEQYAGSRPTADSHMPDIDVPEDRLGWCLYETVSEGTPVTPVFATAAELVDWLATKGQDWDQIPLRRASAEAIVEQGGTLGSMVVTGAGVVLDATVDADILAER